MPQTGRLVSIAEPRSSNVLGEASLNGGHTNESERVESRPTNTMKLRRFRIFFGGNAFTVPPEFEIAHRRHRSLPTGLRRFHQIVHFTSCDVVIVKVGILLGVLSERPMEL